MVQISMQLTPQEEKERLKGLLRFMRRFSPSNEITNEKLANVDPELLTQAVTELQAEGLQIVIVQNSGGQ